MILDLVGSAATLLGLLLATIGLIGMLRRPGIFEQLHASGLVMGPAVFLVLIASVATRSTNIISSALLVALFVGVTAPLSSHAIAQAAWRRRRQRDDG